MMMIKAHYGGFQWVAHGIFNLGMSGRIQRIHDTMLFNSTAAL